MRFASQISGHPTRKNKPLLKPLRVCLWLVILPRLAAINFEMLDGDAEPWQWEVAR